MNIGNVCFNSNDLFAVEDFSDEEKDNEQLNKELNNDLNPFDDGGTETVKVHIRIQQRNGKKSITTIQGMMDSDGKPYKLKSSELDKISTGMKKKFSCGGKVLDNEDYGIVIQLQGDQRINVKEYLMEKYNYKNDEIVIHGF